MPCRRVWLLAPFLFLTGTLQASDLPVFRYALEHWQPEAFDVTIVDSGPLENPELYLIGRTIVGLKDFDRSSRTPYGNYYVQVFDYYMFSLVRLQGMYPGLQTGLADPGVSGVLSVFSAMAFDAMVADASPQAFMAVRAPHTSAVDRPMWVAPVFPDSARAFAISPARRELARRLLSGDSVVWLLLDSGNRDADDRAAILLDKELSRLEKELKLPGAIAEPGSKPQIDLPLQVKFSIMRVRRDDPFEGFLITNLFTGDSNVEKARNSGQPIVFPVFGRGRCLPGLYGAGLTSDGISNAAGELVASCKKEDVSDHPGFDLMLVADWDALVEHRPFELLLDPRLGDFVERYGRCLVAGQIVNLAMPTFGSSIWSTYSLVREATEWVPPPQLHRPSEVTDMNGQPLASGGDADDDVGQKLQSRDARLIVLGVAGGLAVLTAGFMYLARRNKRVA
jgi:hypothetical protein